jgi:hypothetical protein
LWCFLFVCLFVFSFLFFFCFFPLWWDNNRTTSETPYPGLEAEGLTPKLLKLKIYCIWTWRFFNFFTYFFLILFLFLFLFIYLFIYFSQSSLCLSNASTAYCWLVHCLSPLISLKLFLFVCLFDLVFFFVYLSFPLSLTSLLSLSSHPSILNITTVIITS